MHRVLHEALQQAVIWRLLANNPAAFVKPPKVQRAEMKTYDLLQTAELLAALRGNRMFIPTLLAGLCGLRRGGGDARGRGALLEGARPDYPETRGERR